MAGIEEGDRFRDDFGSVYVVREISRIGVILIQHETGGPVMTLGEIEDEFPNIVWLR